MTDLELAGWKYKLWECQESVRDDAERAKALGYFAPRPEDYTPEHRQAIKDRTNTRSWLREEARFMIILGELQRQ